MILPVTVLILVLACYYQKVSSSNFIQFRFHFSFSTLSDDVTALQNMKWVLSSSADQFRPSSFNIHIHAVLVCSVLMVEHVMRLFHLCLPLVSCVDVKWYFMARCPSWCQLMHMVWNIVRLLWLNILINHVLLLFRYDYNYYYTLSITKGIISRLILSIFPFAIFAKSIVDLTLCCLFINCSCCRWSISIHQRCTVSFFPGSRLRHLDSPLPPAPAKYHRLLLKYKATMLLSRKNPKQRKSEQSAIYPK